MKYIALLILVVGVFFLVDRLSFAGAFIMPDNIATKNTPIVLELFTSQSCSSCPPADKVLSEIAKNPNVIALSCHVTYWDHLSWKDTLSKEVCTLRQRSYASGAARNRVFTPELMVNGADSVVGSNPFSVRQALQKNAGQIQTVDIRKFENGDFQATFPKIKTGNISIYIVSFGGDHVQNIARGENGGRVVSYTNPVLTIKTLNESLDSNQNVVNIRGADIADEADGFAVIVHENKPSGLGRILAAGQFKFHS